MTTRSLSAVRPRPRRPLPAPRQVRLFIVLALCLPLLTALTAYLDVTHRYGKRITSLTEVQPQPVAVVLGAGVYRSGRLSAVLADRMDTAIALYQSGKVQKLLLSGDNRFADYNEPAAMGAYAIARGVPAGDLVYDYAGRRTYDSCHRVRHIFGQRQVIVVTQAFHLPRAIYTCQQLGVDTFGVPADQRTYQLASWFSLREAFARLRAWADVHLLRPQPVGGEPIDVFAQSPRP